MRARAQRDGRGGEAEPSTASDEVSRPLFGRWSTALIVALLVGPFAVSYVSSEEPYPAVILPGGATVVSVDGELVTFEIRSHVGYDASGAPRHLDVTDFLDPVPTSHSGALLRSGFGQDDTSTRQVRVDLWFREGAFGVPRSVPSEADQLAAREWINEKLVAAALVPDRFEVWYEEIVIDHGTGDEISREFTDKVVIFD